MQTQRCRGAAAPGGWPGALVSQESLPWLCLGWDSEGQSLPSGCTSAGPGSRAPESPGHCSRPRLLPGPWRSAHSRTPLNTSGHLNGLEPPPPGPLCAPALVTLGKHCCSARWPSQDLLSPEQINGSVCCPPGRAALNKPHHAPPSPGQSPWGLAEVRRLSAEAAARSPQSHLVQVQGLRAEVSR